MQRNILVAAMASALTAPAPLLAEISLEDRLENSEKRIHYLESRIQDQDRVLHQQHKAAGDSWFNRLEISGLIEIEAATESVDDSDRESSLTLATAELGINARLSSNVSAEVVLLYEDDGDEALDVDVAAITLTPTEAWSVTAGQFYLPFGVFETQMISDPLSLELGEIRETALQAGYSSGIFSATVYLFDGDASETDAAKIDNFGLSLDLLSEHDNLSFAASLGYINDIGDSDGLIDYAGTLHDRVGGMAFSAALRSGPFTLIGEYVAATSSFDSGEEPAAFNLEAGYGFGLAGHEANLAIGFQGSDEAEGVGLPEEVVSAAFTVALFEQTSLGLEYARAEAYDGTESDRFILQLASEF